MREIKFRAWIVPTEKMVQNVGITQYDNGSTEVEGWVVQDGDVVLQQFTGLKDKNGVEIYEGDILRISEEHIEVVSWVDQDNWMTDKCPVNGWVNNESIYKMKPEIIGNIYENKDLLK